MELRFLDLVKKLNPTFCNPRCSYHRSATYPPPEVQRPEIAFLSKLNDAQFLSDEMKTLDKFQLGCLTELDFMFKKDLNR